MAPWIGAAIRSTRYGSPGEHELIRMALDSTASSIASNPAAFIVSPDSTNVSGFTIKTTVNPELANKIDIVIRNPEAYAASTLPLNAMMSPRRSPRFARALQNTAQPDETGSNVPPYQVSWRLELAMLLDLNL